MNDDTVKKTAMKGISEQKGIDQEMAKLKYVTLVKDITKVTTLDKLQLRKMLGKHEGMGDYVTGEGLNHLFTLLRDESMFFDFVRLVCFDKTGKEYISFAQDGLDPNNRMSLRAIARGLATIDREGLARVRKDAGGKSSWEMGLQPSASVPRDAEAGGSTMAGNPEAGVTFSIAELEELQDTNEEKEAELARGESHLEHVAKIKSDYLRATEEFDQSIAAVEYALGQENILQGTAEQKAAHMVTSINYRRSMKEEKKAMAKEYEEMLEEAHETERVRVQEYEKAQVKAVVHAADDNEEEESEGAFVISRGATFFATGGKNEERLASDGNFARDSIGDHLKKGMIDVFWALMSVALNERSQTHVSMSKETLQPHEFLRNLIQMNMAYRELHAAGNSQRLQSFYPKDQGVSPIGFIQEVLTMSMSIAVDKRVMVMGETLFDSMAQRIEERRNNYLGATALLLPEYRWRRDEETSVQYIVRVQRMWESMERDRARVAAQDEIYRSLDVNARDQVHGVNAFTGGTKDATKTGKSAVDEESKRDVKQKDNAVPTTICSFFLTREGCRRGDGCRHKHDAKLRGQLERMTGGEERGKAPKGDGGAPGQGRDQPRDRYPGDRQGGPRGAGRERERSCYRCGKPGHVANDCKSAVDLCFGCMKPGHHRNECPELKAATPKTEAKGKGAHAANAATEMGMGAHYSLQDSPGGAQYFGVTYWDDDEGVEDEVEEHACGVMNLESSVLVGDEDENLDNVTAVELTVTNDPRREVALEATETRLDPSGPEVAGDGAMTSAPRLKAAGKHSVLEAILAGLGSPATRRDQAMMEVTRGPIQAHERLYGWPMDTKEITRVLEEMWPQQETEEGKRSLISTFGQQTEEELLAWARTFRDETLVLWNAYGHLSEMCAASKNEKGDAEGAPKARLKGVLVQYRNDNENVFIRNCINDATKLKQRQESPTYDGIEGDDSLSGGYTAVEDMANDCVESDDDLPDFPPPIPITSWHDLQAYEEWVWRRPTTAWRRRGEDHGPRTPPGSPPRPTSPREPTANKKGPRTPPGSPPRSTSPREPTATAYVASALSGDEAEDMESDYQGGPSTPAGASLRAQLVLPSEQRVEGDRDATSRLKLAANTAEATLARKLLRQRVAETLDEQAYTILGELRANVAKIFANPSEGQYSLMTQVSVDSLGLDAAIDPATYLIVRYLSHTVEFEKYVAQIVERYAMCEPKLCFEMIIELRDANTVLRTCGQNFDPTAVIFRHSQHLPHYMLKQLVLEEEGIMTAIARALDEMPNLQDRSHDAIYSVHETREEGPILYYTLGELDKRQVRLDSLQRRLTKGIEGFKTAAKKKKKKAEPEAHAAHDNAPDRLPAGQSLQDHPKVGDGLNKGKGRDGGSKAPTEDEGLPQPATLPHNWSQLVHIYCDDSVYYGPDPVPTSDNDLNTMRQMHDDIMPASELWQASAVRLDRRDRDEDEQSLDENESPPSLVDVSLTGRSRQDHPTYGDETVFSRDDSQDGVWPLLKSDFGLKQSPLSWLRDTEEEKQLPDEDESLPSLEGSSSSGRSRQDHPEYGDGRAKGKKRDGGSKEPAGEGSSQPDVSGHDDAEYERVTRQNWSNEYVTYDEMKSLQGREHETVFSRDDVPMEFVVYPSHTGLDYGWRGKPSERDCLVTHDPWHREVHHIGAGLHISMTWGVFDDPPFHLTSSLFLLGDVVMLTSPLEIIVKGLAVRAVAEGMVELVVLETNAPLYIGKTYYVPELNVEGICHILSLSALERESNVAVLRGVGRGVDCLTFSDDENVLGTTRRATIGIDEYWGHDYQVLDTKPAHFSDNGTERNYLWYWTDYDPSAADMVSPAHPGGILTTPTTGRVDPANRGSRWTPSLCKPRPSGRPTTCRRWRGPQRALMRPQEMRRTSSTSDDGDGPAGGAAGGERRLSQVLQATNEPRRAVALDASETRLAPSGPEVAGDGAVEPDPWRLLSLTWSPSGQLLGPPPAAYITPTPEKAAFIVDGGCSSGGGSGLVAHSNLLEDLRPLARPIIYRAADGTLIKGEAMGTLVLTLNLNGNVVRIPGIILAQSVGINLVSEHALQKIFPDTWTMQDEKDPQGAWTLRRKDPDGSRHLRPDGVVMTASLVKGVYQLDAHCSADQSPHALLAVAATNSASARVWHGRIAHANALDVARTAADKHSGIVITAEDVPDHKCGHCVFGKAHLRQWHRPPPQGIVDRQTGVIEVDYFVGPISVPGWGGVRYMWFCYCRDTRYCLCIPATRRDEATDNLRQSIAYLWRQFDYKVRVIISDNEGNLISNDTSGLVIDAGLHHRRTTPDVHQDGLSHINRIMRTTLDAVRTYCVGGTVPMWAWPYILQTVVHIRNGLSGRKAPHTSPYEIMTKGQKMNYAPLLTIGSRLGLITPPKPGHHKLAPKAVEGVLIGYTGPDFMQAIIAADRGHGLRPYISSQFVLIAEAGELNEDTSPGIRGRGVEQHDRSATGHDEGGGANVSGADGSGAATNTNDATRTGTSSSQQTRGERARHADTLWPKDDDYHGKKAVEEKHDSEATSSPAVTGAVLEVYAKTGPVRAIAAAVYGLKTITVDPDPKYNCDYSMALRDVPVKDLPAVAVIVACIPTKEFVRHQKGSSSRGTDGKPLDTEEGERAKEADRELTSLFEHIIWPLTALNGSLTWAVVGPVGPLALRPELQPPEVICTLTSRCSYVKGPQGHLAVFSNNLIVLKAKCGAGHRGMKHPEPLLSGSAVDPQPLPEDLLRDILMGAVKATADTATDLRADAQAADDEAARSAATKAAEEQRYRDQATSRVESQDTWVKMSEDPTKLKKQSGKRPATSRMQTRRMGPVMAYMPVAVMTSDGLASLARMEVEEQADSLAAYNLESLTLQECYSSLSAVPVDVGKLPDDDKLHTVGDEDYMVASIAAGGAVVIKEHQEGDGAATRVDHGNSRTQQSTTLPQGYKKALAQVETLGVRWDDAMNGELSNFAKKKVYQDWHVRQIPKDATLMRGRWVYTMKIVHDGKDVPKARWVLLGYMQKAEVDYFKTDAPVVDLSVCKALMLWSLAHRRYVIHADVTAAFLNSKADVDIYCWPPEGYASPYGKDGVWLLLSSVYGLKQAPLLWFVTIKTELLAKGYVQSAADPCLFRKEWSPGRDVTVALFVDDFAASLSCPDMEPLFLADIDKFAHKALGQLSRFLGVDYTFSADGSRLFMSQEAYVRDMLTRFGWEAGSGRVGRDTPGKEGMRLGPEDLSPLSELENKEAIEWVWAALGSIRWCARCTRLELSVYVHEISKCARNPGPTVLEAVDDIFAYLYKYPTLGQVFDAHGLTGTALRVSGASDSSWAQEKTTRKSLGGSIVTVGHNVIAHHCKLSSVVAQSSTEAEIYAAADLWKKMLWINQLFDDLGEEQRSNVMIAGCDNQGAIAWAGQENVSNLTKHIDIRYQMLKHGVQGGLVKMVYVKTDDLAADMLTKALGRVKFQRFSAELGIVARATFDLGGEACRAAMGWK